jgi:glutaredoxin
MAMEELKLRGIPFDKIDLKEIGKSAAEVTGRKGVNSVPQVYIAGEYVGGYNELMDFLNKPLVTEEGEECRACEG